MKSVTREQMKRLDAAAIKRCGIPALILMENAGRASAEEALKMLLMKGTRRAAVFCGYGNNGGDGFVCARHLINRGIQTRIYLVGRKKEFSEEARINYQILRKMGQGFKLIQDISVFGKIEKEIKRCHLLIDGIFGIGLRGGLDRFYQELFSMLNAARIPILALDIPSGLDADTGKPLGTAVQAAKTVTFGMLKKGLAGKQARKFTGRISVADISLPRITG
ncbi:MAG: NAD(P)H-hydrate epimerase [Candidatus Omnitrophica bacterium]|nr:NAD(P)H-hydrate epimerase [Candidatus Omnitrophota bacterium]